MRRRSSGCYSILTSRILCKLVLYGELMMKKIIAGILVLGVMMLFGCNEANKNVKVDIVEKISQSCGHISKSGTQFSYDLMLASTYSRENVTWEDFEYDRLEFFEYSELNLTTGEFEEKVLKRDYKYALARINGDSEEFSLVFVYDESREEVVTCFEYRDVAYVEWWSVFEPAFCYYRCKCNQN